MSFEADLRSRLVNDAAVSGMVDQRVYWKIRPQNSVLPAIILNITAGQRAQVMGGVMGTQGNRVQFDCMASSKEAAIALRDAAFNLIEMPGFSGDTTFQGGFVNLYRDAAADVIGGVVHTEMIDVTIWYN
ncbi:tail completion protein gp17 [Tsuneonella suprasediminis]|uniref:tail completion protein gp17 n=1 Tax=Tsuneonella suprasediminis TaxID=2306996 RepID=UPI002F9390B8